MRLREQLHELHSEVFPKTTARALINVAAFEGSGIIASLDPSLSESAAQNVSGGFGALGLACLYGLMKEKKRIRDIVDSCDYTKYYRQQN